MPSSHSDLCVGLITQPLYATFTLNAVTPIKLNVFCNIQGVYVALTFILCGLSIFTSTAISVDRLLALLLGLRYRQVVTLQWALLWQTNQGDFWPMFGCRGDTASLPPWQIILEIVMCTLLKVIWMFLGLFRNKWFKATLADFGRLKAPE